MAGGWSTDRTHHDLAELALGNITQLNLLDRDGLSCGPVERTCAVTGNVSWRKWQNGVRRTIDLAKRAFAERVTELLVNR